MRPDVDGASLTVGSNYKVWSSSSYYGNSNSWHITASSSQYTKVKITINLDEVAENSSKYRLLTVTGEEATPTPTISSVNLIGDINGWSGNARALTDNGNNEYSITISATDVRNNLNGGVFRFRFIQVMSGNIEYGIYPNTNATALTSGAAYNTDTYSTTETTTGSYKDYYWTVTPADNDVSYTFYFKNDGTPQVKYTVTTMPLDVPTTM